MNESTGAAFSQLLSPEAGGFLLFFTALIIFVSIGIVTYVLVTARARALSSSAAVIEERDRAISQLTEAEEIGRVGSFAWDFENPARSYWSKEMFDLFGLIPRKKIPASDALSQYIHEGDRVRFEGAWKRALTQPGDFTFSFRTVSNRGQVRNVQVQGRTTLNDTHGTKLIHGVVHDVTKEMEVDRAKSEFVSLASHQLKTPLTSIKWLSEMLAAENAEPLSPKQLEYVRTIKASTQQMVEMVNDLLNMSRIELGTLAMTIEEFNIDTLVRSVAAEQEHAAELKKVMVQLISDPKLPILHADQKLVRMILQNLLSNAIKYSHDGGSVEFELSLVSSTHESIFVRVKDSGIGIPEKEQQNVFQKLYRAENAQKLVPDGTGLGLYVMKTILARAGGGITFESKEGKGTTFFVSIPVIWPSGEKPA